MSDQDAKARVIFAEAVGERPDTATPDVVKEEIRGIPEEAVRRRAMSVGPQASMAAKTAEAIGESPSGAYPGAGSTETEIRSREVAEHTRTQRWRFVTAFDRQHVMTAAAGFCLGYVTAVLLHRER